MGQGGAQRRGPQDSGVGAQLVGRLVVQVAHGCPYSPYHTPDKDPPASHHVHLSPQVVEETHLILKEYGFRFVRRGAIYVKGKGELLTFFLKGREKQGSFINGSSVTLPHQVVDSS